MRPWYETTFRWGQTNLSENDPAACDLDFWREQWKRTYVQGLIINCGGIVAFYPSRFPLQHRAQGIDEQNDYFNIFSEAAREAGLVVVARMDINRAGEDFYKARPDWFCLDRDGRPITSQGRYFSCIQSGYYSEYIPDVLREIIERYKPAGFADNSWKGLDGGTVCYCENCRRSFREACGVELPESAAFEDPAYKAWVGWGKKRREEIWDLFNETTRSAGGPDCLWCGMLSGDIHNLGGQLADLYNLCKRSKIIFCDHQSRDLSNGFEQNGMTGSLLRLASHENILVPESMANYVRGDRTFRIAANPAAETRFWMLDGIAGGLSPWFHHIGGGQKDRRQFETPVPVFKWHKENEEYLYNREDTANIGLVWGQDRESENGTERYGRGNAYEQSALPFRGFMKALTRARLPYLPIHMNDIKKYAHRLKCLILPNIFCLNDEQTEAVKEFTLGGGGLVFTGGALTPDNPLFEMAGLRPTGAFFGAAGKSGSSWEQYEAHNYLLLPVPLKRHEIFRSFKGTDIIPFGGGLPVIESDGTLAPVAGYIPGFPIYPPEFSYIREERPDTGTVFAGALHKGRAVYFAADIDRCYGRNFLPDHGMLLADAVLWTLGGAVPLTVEGPGYLDCRMYRQGKRIIIHLVNLSGCGQMGYMEEAYPVGPVTIAVHINESISRAVFTVAGREETVRRDNPFVLCVEKLDMHEMIVLE